MRHPHTQLPREFLIAVAVVAVFLAAIAYAFVRMFALEARVAELTAELASTTAVVDANRTLLASDLLALRAETVGISETLAGTKADVMAAQSNISDVRNQVGGVQQTVGSISGAVTTLEKLTKTDPELLQKYSKVFFLNENYRPRSLTNILQDYVYSNSKPEAVATEVAPFMNDMLAAAKSAGLQLYVKSAYRSFEDQQVVKSQHVTAFGAGTANAFSADQGYSEHQLGTTVDLVTNGMNGQLIEAFDDTQAFQWLSQNAHRYGFIMSYPQGNSFYEYEPWHWRFVGVKLATYMKEQNRNFYNLDQREIDAYLAELFDR